MDLLDAIGMTFMDSLCNALSIEMREVCGSFILDGYITVLDNVKYPLQSVLQDTGALGSSFISDRVINDLKDMVQIRPLVTGRRVRLGNKVLVDIHKEAVVTLSVIDAQGVTHTHAITCAVLPDLSHDVIIGLFDLMGPFYSAFVASIQSARTLVTNVSATSNVTNVFPTCNNLRSPLVGNRFRVLAESDSTDVMNIDVQHVSPDAIGDDVLVNNLCVKSSSDSSSNLINNNSSKNTKKVRFNIRDKKHSNKYRNYKSYSYMGMPNCGYSPDRSKSITDDVVPDLLDHDDWYDIVDNSVLYDDYTGYVRSFDLRAHVYNHPVIDTRVVNESSNWLHAMNVPDTVSLTGIKDHPQPLPDTTMVENSIGYPWSKPLDEIAPEELETPDPLFFNEDVLYYLSTTHEEALAVYYEDLKTHIMPPMLAAYPRVYEILTSADALDTFCPSVWNGLNMDPIHLETAPGLPTSMRAKPRPIREAIFEPARTEFKRMETYMYAESKSPVACPLVVAPKATFPFVRLCGDYRPINPFITVPQVPIPNVQQYLTKAAGFKVFVDLDMTNSFHQIPLDEASSNLLSVATPWGLKRPLFLPEGVGPATGYLQSIVTKVFEDYMDWIIVIFDNFLVCANDYEDAALKLEKVIKRCKEKGLVLKMKKSWIGTDKVTFFGYEVRPGSWSLSDERKQSIADMVFPASVKQMQIFLGAANFFRNHVANYAEWSKYLEEMTQRNFDWKNEASWKRDYRKYFNDFKEAITKALTLYFPDYSLKWCVRADSSSEACGAVLFQEYIDPDGKIIPQPIAFASHKYSGAACKWDIHKQEAYALYFACLKFSYYLRGKEFLLETDHRNLLWMEASVSPIVVRWRVLIQSFKFMLRHIKGKDNVFADWLTRMFNHLLCDMNVSEQYPNVKAMFDEVHGGRNLHHGAKRTYYNLCERFPGHGVPMHVIRDLVEECPLCQKDRLPGKHPANYERIETLTQHERVIGIDHITVTPHDDEGHVGLLAVIEQDFKFAQFYPVKDYTAITVASKLFKHYCTFGRYDGILSDPGSAFMSEVVSHLNQWFGIPHLISLVERHESNGTEHSNHLFMGHLRRLVHDERLANCWSCDHVLPLITHAILTTPNEELGGYSPMELKFGTLAFQYFELPTSIPPGGQGYTHFVQCLNENLRVIRSLTSQFQLEVREYKQRLNENQNVFQPGDLILWNPKEHQHSHRVTKLSPRLYGPYIVIEQLRNDVMCRHLSLNTEHKFHSSRVYPFFGNLQEAKRVAMLDSEEYLVESILEHEGDPRRKTSMRFLVKWLDSNTWQSYYSLHDNSVFHKYCRNNGLSRIIPTNHL